MLDTHRSDIAITRHIDTINNLQTILVEARKKLNSLLCGKNIKRFSESSESLGRYIFLIRFPKHISSICISYSSSLSMRLVIYSFLLGKTVDSTLCWIYCNCQTPIWESDEIQDDAELQRLRTMLAELFSEQLADTPEGAALRMSRPFRCIGGAPSLTTWSQVWEIVNGHSMRLAEYDFLSLFPSTRDFKKLPAILRLVGTRRWLTFNRNISGMDFNDDLIDLLMGKPFYAVLYWEKC